MNRHLLAAPALLVLALSTVVTTTTATAAPITAATALHHATHGSGGVIVWQNASTFDEIDATTNLMIANADGSHERAFTAKVDGVADADSAVSPDGRLVAWARNSETGVKIMVKPVRGGPERALDLGCGDDCFGDDKPTWISANRVAFTRYLVSDSYPAGYAGVLFAANLDGSHLRQLSPDQGVGLFEDQYADLSPDGTYFVFARTTIEEGDAAAFRMQRNGSHVRQLTPWDLQAQLPRLSPASHGPTRGLVVFQSYGQGNPEGTSRDLATVPADCRPLAACAKQIVYVTDNGPGLGRASNPAWSPDGRRIAYAARPNADELDCQIVTIRWNNTDLRVVSSSPTFDYRPSWGP